jgi:methionyl-tRNA synthetase
MKNKFYITTAIDYVNAEPHIGHAYQKIVADALARWHKLKGNKVFFLTGTDEHGQKIARSAKEAGLSEKEFVDKMSKKFKEAWENLDISFDRFIRTTDKDHEKFVQDFVKKIEKDIYKGSYEGLYCVGCERFYPEKDLNNGECFYHPGKKLELLKEETYYFKLSKYQKQLLKLYKNKDFVLPQERRNEIVNRVEEGLQDLSITRTGFSWGIPFPLDKKHVIYVWFDALLNYLSGAGKKQEFWPADVHLLGKDNGWFHAVIWPAMLLAGKYKVPKTVFIHGFLTFNGQKISKSLGNVISPNYLAGKYGSDGVRYYSLRNFVFGEDGDFSEQVLKERYNNELANKLGNLVNRVTTLAEKIGVEKCENELLRKNLLNYPRKIRPIKDNNSRLNQIEKYIETYQLDKALNEIFYVIDVCNEYIQKTQPWKESCEDRKKILYELLDSIKSIAILLWPFIPETSEKIAKNLKFEIKYENLKKPLGVKKVTKAEILFKKIE